MDCPFGIFLDLYAYDNLADGKFAYHWQVWTAWFWSKLLILRSVPHPYIGLTGWKYSVAQGICAFATWSHEGAAYFPQLAVPSVPAPVQEV